MIFIFLMLMLSCGKKNNLNLKTKHAIIEIAYSKGEEFVEKFSTELSSKEREEEKKDFVFELLEKIDEKDRDEKSTQILLAIAEESIDNFSLNDKEQLRYGGDVFSKMVSYGEIFDKSAIKLIGSCKTNISLFSKLMSYLQNKNYKTKIYSLYNKYVAERTFKDVGMTIDGCKMYYYTKKEKLDKGKISESEFEQSLEKMLYCILISNKEDFRFDFMDWLIDNQKYIKYRRLTIDPINRGDLIIHSSVRYYDIELFTYLVNKGNKMNFKPEIPFLDPIQLLIVEASMNGNQEKALNFLNKIEKIEKVNIKKLTKERGYLHFSSYFCLEQLIDFFLKYIDVNEYYDASITYTTINKYGDNIWKKDFKDEIKNVYDNLIKYNGASDFINNIDKDRVTSTALSFALGKVSVMISVGSLSKEGRVIMAENYLQLINPILNYRCEQNNSKLQKTIRKLVSRGANINIPNKNGVYFFEKIFSNSSIETLGIMKIIFEETSINLSMNLKNRMGKTVEISKLIISTIKKHKENQNLELYTYKNGGMNKFQSKIEDVQTISRKKIEYMSPLITHKLLKKDIDLTRIYKDTFDIKGNRDIDFIKLIRMYKDYPNYVSLIVKYPIEFGFKQYNKMSFLDIMFENECDESLISLAKESGYLTQVEIDEIAENMKKIEENAQKSLPKRQKGKKKKKKREIEYSSAPEIVEERVPVEDKYDFNNILKANEDIKEEFIIELIEKDIKEAKKVINILLAKSINFNNMDRVISKALEKSQEFATFLLNKGFKAGNKDFLIAVSKDEHIFVKRFVEYNDLLDLREEEKSAAKEISISKKMQRVLKEHSIYFSFDDEILDSSSEEEEEEEDKYLFKRVYIHNSIVEKDRDYIEGHIEEGRVIRDKIKDISLGRKLDVIHSMKEYSFINLRVGDSRIYYYIENNNMYIVGFNMKKNKATELKSNLMKYEERSKNRIEEDYSLAFNIEEE